MPAIAVAWFKREDYYEVRRLCVDSMHPTFEAWEQKMVSKLTPLEARGLKFERVIVEPDKLKAWAAERGIPLDSQARSSFAAMTFARRGQH